MKRLSLLLILLTAVALAHAQPATRYISDQLEVTLRSGHSTQHRIISMLPSGTRVDVLEEERESGYARVRTADGTEGWVLIRYLDNTPSARERLAAAQQDLSRQTAAAEQTREELRELSQENAALKKQIEELTRDHQESDQELTRIRRASASVLAIEDENRTLKETLSRLEREHQMVQQQNEVLKDRTARDWFMVGAGVVLLGIIIGLIIPKIRWRRKSQWDRF